MKPMTQTKIASIVGASQPYINQVVTTKKRPSWKMAKKLSSAVPGTTPILWLEGTPDQIRDAIKNASNQ